MTTPIETFESYRPLLFSVAYRMLGSAMEAEDILQEAYLRFETARAADILSLKAYLTTIVTRLCLDQLKSARVRRESYIGTWLPEPLFTASPSSEAEVAERETVSMAFLLVLERLSPVERAVFLLRDVFDYSYAEIARVVGKSEVNCRRYHHLARQFLVENRPRFEPSSDEHHKLLDSFIQAISMGNVDGLAALLAEEVAVYSDGGGKVPTAQYPVFGRAKAARLLERVRRLAPADFRMDIAEVNATLSILLLQGDALLGVMTFRITGGLIQEIHGVFNPDKLQHLARHKLIE